MENTSFSFKSLDWNNLLKEASDDSCDSDETFIDAIDNATDENCLQHWDQNSNKHEGEIYHQPMVQEVLDTISSIQSAAPWPNEERSPNSSDQNIQNDLEEDCKVYNESHVEDYNSSFKFSGKTIAVNKYPKEGNEKNHRFESDFSFTDMSCPKDISSSTNETKDFCTNNPTLSTDFNSNKSEEFESDICLFLKNNVNESETLDTQLKMCLGAHETDAENTLELGAGARSSQHLEEQSRNEYQSAIPEGVEEDHILDGIMPNLDHVMRESFFDTFIGYEGTPKIKPCSPPLTLSKGTRRKILPADKVLPNIKKKNWQTEKKLLPKRKCLSAYINVSNRKFEDDIVTGTTADTEESDTLCHKTDSAAQDIIVQQEPSRKPVEEVTKTKNSGKLKQNFPIKGKRGRKKKGVFVRVKQETENTSQRSCPERELKNGVDETLQDMQTNVQYLEERIAHWINGTNEEPPTREQAFKMLADTQAYIATLKKKNRNKRKELRKCEQKLEKLLLERLQQLEIGIDKAIAEADRLMNMELDEISEDSDSWTTGKENCDKEMTRENKYPKPILKNSSSEPSTEEVFEYKRRISFSEEVECRYLSCSEQSSSLGPSQSFCEQESENDRSCDKKDTNSVSRYSEKVSSNIDYEKSSYTNLTCTDYFRQENKPLENHQNPDLDMLSFQNLTIDPSNIANHGKPLVRQSYKRKNFVVGPVTEKSSQTKNISLMRNLDKDERQKIEIDHCLDSINNVVDTNWEQNSFNASSHTGENQLTTGNESSQFSFSVSNYDPVFDNSTCIQNQTRDCSEEVTIVPSYMSVNDQKNESYIEKTEKRNIQMDENNSFVSKQIRPSYTEIEVKDNILKTKTSFQCPKAQLKVNIHSTGETDNSKENTFQKLSENLTQQSEQFAFSEQSAEVEKSWENVTLMSIKSIRIKDSSEFMPWNPCDPPDDWADLEDW